MRGWKWVAPGVVVLALVTVLPLGRAIWTSLHRSALTAPGSTELVGLDNYQNVLSNRDWWQAVATTLVIVGGVVLAQVVLGCLFGAALNRWARIWPAARVLSLLPLGLLSIVSVVLWRDAADTGYLAQWFGDVSPLVAVTVAEVWRGTGLVVLVVALALRGVPGHLLASATADGATLRQRWTRVVLPSIGPALAAIVAFRVFDTFRVLDGPLLVDRPGGSRPASVLMWNTQFTDFELGLGAAMSLVLLVVAIVLAAIIVPLLRVRSVTHEGGAPTHAATAVVSPPPSIRSRLAGAAVAFLLGFAAANYGAFNVARPDLWIWVAVAVALMATGVFGVITADSERDFSIWAILGAELFAIFSLVPLLWALSVATTPPGTTRTTLWPSGFSWSAFGEARRSGVLLDAADTSLLVAGVATLLALLVAVPVAVALVRGPLPGRRFVHAAFVAALVLPTVVLAAPASAQLLAWGLSDSRLAAAVPTLALSLPLAVWLCVRLVGRAPWTLHTAMRADGADRRQRLRLFVLPHLGMDVLAVALVVFFWTAGDLALGLAMAPAEASRSLPATLLVLTGRGEVSSAVVAAVGIVWLLAAALVLIVFSRRLVALLERPRDGVDRTA